MLRKPNEEDRVRITCLEIASHYGASSLDTEVILRKAGNYLKFINEGQGEQVQEEQEE